MRELDVRLLYRVELESSAYASCAYCLTMLEKTAQAEEFFGKFTQLHYEFKTSKFGRFCALQRHLYFYPCILMQAQYFAYWGLLEFEVG